MRRYNVAVNPDLRQWSSPPHRQRLAQISEELRIHIVTLYNWRKAWRLQGEAVLASAKEPEDLALLTSSRWFWRLQGSMPLSSAPIVVNGVCARSRWSAGGKHPRMSTRSQCSP